MCEPVLTITSGPRFAGVQSMVGQTIPINYKKSNGEITKGADLYQTRIPSEQTTPLHHRLLVLLVLRRLGRP